MAGAKSEMPPTRRLGNFIFANLAVSPISGTALGARSPDIVASLDVTQSWGGAHLAGVAHNDRYSISGVLSTTLPLTNPVIFSTAASADTWGFGVIGGVTFNLPMLSAGSKIAFQGAYAEGAIGYAGAGSPGWGEGDQGFNTNGNGLIFPMADGIFNPLTGTFEKSKAWTAAAQLTWKVAPGFEIDPEVAYASVEYDSATAALWQISPSATAWWVGAVFDWSPVKNLDFAFDAIYESSHQSTPAGWTTAVNGAFQNNADGFNGRLHVVRSF